MASKKNMQKRHLIYMISLGDRVYHEMTHLCVQSLRRWGKFAGDILLFTDNRYPFHDEGVRQIKVKESSDPFEIKMLKTMALREFDISNYSYVTFMDTDMLVIASIEPFLSAQGSQIVCASDCPFNSMLTGPHGGDLFKLQERSLAQLHWGINTGFLSMRQECFAKNMSLWSSAIMRAKPLLHHWVDQPPFNLLALRKKLRVKLLPRGAVECPIFYAWAYSNQFRISPITTILHFTGADKESCLAAMNLAFNQLKRTRSRKKLEGLLVRLMAPYRSGIGNNAF